MVTIDVNCYKHFDFLLFTLGVMFGIIPITGFFLPFFKVFIYLKVMKRCNTLFLFPQVSHDLNLNISEI